jgi:putative addiction module killer protein
MYKIKRTQEFINWLANNKDPVIRVHINNRIDRVTQGNFGFYKRLNEHLYELKFKQGNGYRIYFTIIDKLVVLLVFAGTKDTQSKDIKLANKLLDKYTKGVNNEY